MTNAIKLNIAGLADVRKALLELTPKLRRQALGKALRAGARVVVVEARRRAPVLKTSTYAGASAIKRGVRAVGTIRKAIGTVTSKTRARGEIGVSVLVRPLKGGGKKNPKDPFYWVFQEFGWTPASGATGGAKGSAGKRYRRYLSKGAGKAKPGAFFMRAGAGKLGEAKRVIENSLSQAVQRFQSQSARKRPG